MLFTDADVLCSLRCFRKAVVYDTHNVLDHVTISPEIVSRGVLLKGFVAAFSIIFETAQRGRSERATTSKRVRGE